MLETSPYVSEIFWSGKGKEAWDEECKRWHSLTMEQRQKEYDEYNRKKEEYWKKVDEKRAQEKALKQQRDEASTERAYIYNEQPHSLDNGEATVTWLVIMAVATIFRERWLVWIGATVIYLCHIFRHDIRRWKWEHGGKEEYEQELKDICNGKKK